MVHGPYNDFRRMAANRLVSDQLRRQLAWDKTAWMRVADKERERADKHEASFLAERDRNKLMKENLEQATTVAHKCCAKARRSATWATVGKVGVVTVGFAGAIMLAEMLFGPVH